MQVRNVTMATLTTQITVQIHVDFQYVVTELFKRQKSAMLMGRLQDVMQTAHWLFVEMDITTQTLVSNAMTEVQVLHAMPTVLWQSVVMERSTLTRVSNAMKAKPQQHAIQTVLLQSAVMA